MIRYLFIILVGIMHLNSGAQIRIEDSNINSKDTLKSFFTRKNPPYLYNTQLKHCKTSIWNKMLRGTLYVAGYNISMGSYLLIAPEHISNWSKKDKFKIESIATQYRKSFTLPPVIDNDLWVVNYVGHPYQGSYYYNSIRSQNASVTQSALFCIGQSFLWEYGWEAGMEQPSIQDIISTPLAGILVGELCHVATIKMSIDGFRWYEVVLVCLINPAYAINNGFKTKRKLSTGY